ncbi:MAG: Dabb family protein [Cytophagaceae bacterium]|jgi:hypothetical protein|nr:Dabb family protein [Cytophagaceae bacterium]
MIKHIVLFKFKELLSQDERVGKSNNIKLSLEALKDIIKPLRMIEAGVNINPNENYDLALTTLFDNWDDLKFYAEHPEHQKVSVEIRKNMEQRACVDYEI